MMGSTIMVDHLTQQWATAAAMDLSTENWSRDGLQMNRSVAQDIAMVVFLGRPIGRIGQEIHGHHLIPSIDGLMPRRGQVPNRTRTVPS